MHRISFCAGAAALALGAMASSASAQDFRALAQQDLQAAHDALAANHPAAVTPGQQGDQFRAWIGAGLQDALGRVAQVNSGDSHAYLLRYYGAGFRDSNISIRPTYEGLGPYFATSWPGFTTGWRDGKYVVTYVTPGLRGAPPVGAVLTDCNLTPIEEFARGKLDRWEGNLETQAGRATSAPYLLWNRNNPFTAGLPSVCSFQEGRRRPREYQIRPQPADAASLEAAYRATVYMPPATPLSIETVNGRPWLNIHSLDDNAGWEAFNAAIEAQAATLRGAQGFVIDLRGARVSSPTAATSRGYGVINRIWTTEYAASRQPSVGVITYRATQGNRDWYADVLRRMEGDADFAAQAPAVIEQTREIVAAFDAAIAAGQTSFTMTGQDAAPAGAAVNPVQGPVVVLVDEACSSGCLDTLDLLSRLPNVRIAGRETAADTIFIDPTVERLPSNYAQLSYGHKAWTARERGDNQPYSPTGALAYTGDPVDEPAVRAWAATLFQ